MEVRPFPSARHAAHDLTKAAEFTLGPLSVDPPARRVGAGARSEMIEPRVMRVLVALGSAGGKVLSRDDLIELCWDGTIVGDNAINKVIFRLRHALEELSDGSVRLETIPRVGFRLVVDGQATEEMPRPESEAVADVSVNAEAPFWTRKMTRRAAVGGIALLGGGALAYATLDSPARHVPDPRALDLYRRGQLTQKGGAPGSMRQAMAYYKQAIEIDPNYADAWGALAIGYRHGGDGFVKEPREAYPRLVRSAAGRALALDPDQPDARMALATIYSHFGRWRQREAQLRAIVRRSPDYWFGYAQLDQLMQDVGRVEEGIVFRQRMLEIDPMIPLAWARLARGLHYAGRDHEADIALDRAFARWPANPVLWYMRWQILIGGKRYAEAAAFMRDPRSRPEDLPDEIAERNARIADALATQTGIEPILAQMHRLTRIRVDVLPTTAALAAELGDATMAFDALQAYFYGGRINEQRVAPPDRADARQTAVLFSPSLLALKDDPRHSMLLRQTGLETYWRESGTQPDFRKR